MKRHNKNVPVGSVPERRGSTLLIVLSLLGLLTLLGLIFFTFANQERISAEYFSQAAKNEPDQDDNGMDYGMKQVLLGANNSRRNSALFGRAGIVTNLMGNDSRPNSGSGVNMIYWDDPNTPPIERIPVVDQDRNGIPDHVAPGDLGTPTNHTWPDPRPSISQLGNIVDSQVAHGLYRDTSEMPSPDSGTTYPDQNSPYLSYRGYALREVGGAVQMWPVIIPSYMRPALFRQGPEPSATATNWYNDFGPDGLPGTVDDPYRGVSFRPHRSHVFVNRDGSLVDDGTGNPVRRFLDAAVPADAAIVAGFPGGSPAFPFAPPSVVTGDPLHDAKDGELGIWTATSAELSVDADGNGVPDFDPLVYELDVDTDGDGIADAIWLDLDHPVIEDPATGAKYTYLYAVSITDMEALINLNAHGNVNGDRTTFTPVGGVDADLGRIGMYSKSNAGMTPSEINPLWALMRDPALAATPGTTFEQHNHFYGHLPADAYELANMEWLWLLLGRPQLTAGPVPVTSSDISDLFAGRFGEPERLYDAVTNATNLGNFFFRAPKPGLARQDDNNDILEGVPGYGMRGLTTPLDFNGSGRWVSTTNPRLPFLRQVVDQNTLNPTAVPVPQYLGYNLFSKTGNTVDTPLGPNQLYYRGENGVWDPPGAPGNDDIVDFPIMNQLYDDMNEGMNEPEHIERPFDEPFTAAELLTLHMTDADRGVAGDQASERLLKLAPYAFDRPQIRERFTTLSWAMREHSLSFPFPPGNYSPFGKDGAPGWSGIDDDNDGITDFDGNGNPDMDEVGIYDPNDGNRSRRHSEDGHRAWLFSADTALFDSNDNGALVPNQRYEFPPRYGRSQEFTSREFASNSPLYAQTFVTANVLSEDPFRPQLRRLLRMEANDRKATFGQLPLNINRFLDVERLPNRSADLLRGVLEYRALTEHVDSQNADGSVSTPTLQNTLVTPCPYPPNDDTGNGDGSVIDEMEYWARRDRQKMARDIYVLLYTLGGGNDSINYTSSNLAITPGVAPNPPSAGTYTFYTPAQLRQMAQFAVNLVDALDRDNVSTRFEYDKNLGDTVEIGNPGNVLHSGWNLDDNATTRDTFAPIPDTTAATVDLTGGYDGNYPEDSYERGVVYGVEKQELAFSEILAIYTRETMGDHSATLYEEDSTAHAFLHIELRNMTSEDLPVATPESTNDATAIYRIRRFNENTPANLIRENHGKIAFLQNAPVVPAGDIYTVATSAGTDLDATASEHRSSDFYVDFDLDGSFNRISPAIDGSFPTATSLPSDASMLPRADIDLVHRRDRDTGGVFSVNGHGSGGDTEGQFLTEIPGGETRAMFDPMDTSNMEGHVLVLERRANPHMPSLPLAENPWIEVDRSYAMFEEFTLDMEVPPAIAGVGGPLEDLHSEERVEPLLALEAGVGRTPAYDAATGRHNSIGERPAAPAPFLLVQPHYDRDFTSVGELLQLPLFGPDSLTTQLQDSLGVPSNSGMTDQHQRAHVAQPWMPSPMAGLTGGSSPPVQTYGRARPFNQALVSGANAKFLMADFPDGSAAAPFSEFDLDNRWYMLFAVTEVATRTHKQLGNPLVNLERIPGKINLNTLRHPEVLQALLDDPLVVDLNTPGTLPENSVFGEANALSPSGASQGAAAFSDPGRDWMQELIRSRDGSFVAAGHTLYIPGLPGSRPFQAFGRMDANQYSLNPLTHRADIPMGTDPPRSRISAGFDMENTIFRGLSLDFVDGDDDGVDDNNSQRRLFEVGTATDFTSNGLQAGPPAGRVTPQTRHRLLSKLLNNTTTSSNTFVVHMTIGLFEVHEDTATGVVRIGGEFDLDQNGSTPIENNRKRSVFLIDRSEVFDAFNAGAGQFNQFDYRRLIKHEVTIQ